MALNKKGYRRISIGNDIFFWRIRRKVSHNEKHNEELPIPIQHINGGQILFVYMEYCRSTNYTEWPIHKITPIMIREQIEIAIQQGWKYQMSGKPLFLKNNQLFNS